jgi:hypothetical protein
MPSECTSLLTKRAEELMKTITVGTDADKITYEEFEIHPREIEPGGWIGIVRRRDGRAIDCYHGPLPQWETTRLSSRESAIMYARSAILGGMVE